MRKARRKSSRKPSGEDGVSTGPLCEPQPVRRSSVGQLVQIPWLFHVSPTLKPTDRRVVVPPLLCRVARRFAHRPHALKYRQGRFEPAPWGNIRSAHCFADGLKGVVREFSEPGSHAVYSFPPRQSQLRFEIAIVSPPEINRAAVDPGSLRRLRNACATGEGFDDLDLLGTECRICRILLSIRHNLHLPLLL